MTSTLGPTSRSVSECRSRRSAARRTSCVRAGSSRRHDRENMGWKGYRYQCQGTSYSGSQGLYVRIAVIAANGTETWQLGVLVHSPGISIQGASDSAGPCASELLSDKSSRSTGTCVRLSCHRLVTCTSDGPGNQLLALIFMVPAR
jgi:hypothetical protein